MNAPAQRPRNAEPVTQSARKIALIAVHCSATPDDRTLFYGTPGTASLRTPADEIDTWHYQRGFRRGARFVEHFNPNLQAIGYHFVIARNGALLTGRHPDEVPAHAKGHNSGALAICLVGQQRYTAPQWAQLANLVRELATANRVPVQPVRVGALNGVCGHRDLSPDLDGNGRITRNEWLKLCPGFSVADWLAGDLAPLPDHVAPEVSK